MNNFEKLKDLIVSQLSLSEDAVITMDTQFRQDLGIDSLDMLTFAGEVESTFSIKIEEDYTDHWVTVRDVLNYIEKH